MTNLYYGDILIHNVITRRWDEELIYDATGVDVLAHKWSIVVEGMIADHGDDGVAQATLQTTNTHEINDPTIEVVTRGGDASERYADIRKRLMTSRKELRITIGDPKTPSLEKTLLHVLPASTSTVLGLSDPDAPSVDRYGDDPLKSHMNIDTDNGPKPRGCNLIHITGSSIYRVSFAVDVVKVDCLSGEGRGTPDAALDPTYGIVVSNRWQSKESFDGNFFCTRIVSGRLRVSSRNVTPHMYRGLCIPELEKGFKRNGFEFAESADGLELEYSIQDKQVKTAAPWPATSISGSHSIGIRDQYFIIGTCTVHLEGPPQVAKELLVARAVQIVHAKLHIPNLNTNQFIFEHGSIVDQFGENNAVDITMQVRYTPGNFDSDDKVDIHSDLVRFHRSFADPLEMPDIVDEDGNTMQYSNIVSPSPPAYGYNVSAYNEEELEVVSSSSSGSETVENPSRFYGVRQGGFLAFMRCWYQSPCDAQLNHYMPVAGETEWSAADDAYGDYSYTIPDATQYPPGSVPGTVDPDDDYINDDAKTNIFTYYRAETELIENRLRIQLPLADATTSGTGSVFATLGPVQCKRVVRIEAERVGGYPNMPDPDEVVTLGGIDHYPTGRHKINFQDPKLTADGKTFVYLVTAEYEYGLERQPQGTDELIVGVPLFSTLVRDDESLVREDYYKLESELYE